MLVKDAINQYFPYPLNDYVITKLIEDDAYYTRMRGAPDIKPFNSLSLDIFNGMVVPFVPCMDLVVVSFGGNSAPRQLLRDKEYSNDQEYLKDLMNAMLADESYEMPKSLEISPINSFKQILENL